MVIGMNIDDIFAEIILNKDEQQIVDLAKKEVMTAPLLITQMLENSDIKSESVLIKFSEQSPLLLYPYFTYIAQASERYNNVIAWNSWKIIANLLIVDYLDLWQDIKERYFKTFESELITEVLNSISVAKTIIDCKPDDKDTILRLIRKCGDNNYTICDEPAPHINTVAKQAIDEFFNNL